MIPDGRKKGRFGAIRNYFLALVVLGSGLLNLYSVAGKPIQHRVAILREIFPLVFIHLSRFLGMLTGFALVILSINIYKRKKRALQITLLLSVLSIFFYLLKGLDYEEAVLSVILVVLLWLSRKNFTVGSGIPSLKWGFIQLAVAVMAALIYGTVGFWFLDKRQFGINFTIGASIKQTFAFLSLMGDPEIIPRTRHARWFLDSLNLMTATATLYALVAVFRPVLYRFRTLPHERRFAQEITARHGRSALDFFKYWPDKTYFFPESRQCYIAFRVGGGYAVALGDPVGPEEEIEPTIRAFEEYCKNNDWRVAFHQVLPDFLPIYQKIGFRKLKIGDEAIVDLRQFSLGGKESKKLRHEINQLEKQGIRFTRYDPPISPETMSNLEEVSDGWLQIPGRRERTFTLGVFDSDYVQSTAIYAAVDGNGRILAFMNSIPSFCKGEATIDLMRYLPDTPPGIMDFLFIKLFFAKKEEGFQRFSLGMAPMAGFQEHEKASAEERAVHYFMQQLHFLFSYQGLLHYKAKFATIWEPRYTIYRNVLNLPRVARAISAVSEIRDDTKRHKFVRISLDRFSGSEN
jgi:phosphatidylglycerol lysyltransferase